VAFRSLDEYQNALERVAQARHTIDQLHVLAGDLGTAESGVRGYSLTGKQTHLEPYYAAAGAAVENIKDLSQLFAGNSEQSVQVKILESQMQLHLKLLKEMADLGAKSFIGGGGQKGLADRTALLSSQIRTGLAQLGEQEQAELRAREAALASTRQQLGGKITVTVTMAVVLVVLTAIESTRAIRFRRKAESELDGLLESTPDAIVIVGRDGRITTSNSQSEHLFGFSRQELIGQAVALLVPERYRQRQQKHLDAYFHDSTEPPPAASLELYAVRKDGHEFPVEMATKPLFSDDSKLLTCAIRDISHRKQIEQQITNLNEQLEARASQLEDANRELEAFSYSVSHDLRAPLQTIDGFTRIVIEDYSEQLDRDGLDYLDRVRNGCRRMSEIVDALLVLAKMTRAELKHTDADLTAVARTVAQELAQRAPGRTVEFAIADGLTAHCDAQLVRVVFENLLGNAWKFSAKHERARIEVGTIPQPSGDRVFFVRDDGAGFDMARAKRLFTAFKRLHDQSDFSGTGIGLATVQRIIHRHGGKIWAEGAVERGATFCFTLPQREPTGNGNGHHS
jgi:PAS domain S-box-containing protein